jgi:hypothetical protein
VQDKRGRSPRGNNGKRKMENGKWKIETLPSFSIFRFPFSVDKARTSAFLMLLVQNAKFKPFWCKADNLLKNALLLCLRHIVFCFLRFSEQGRVYEKTSFSVRDFHSALFARGVFPEQYRADAAKSKQKSNDERAAAGRE